MAALEGSVMRQRKVTGHMAGICKAPVRDQWGQRNTAAEGFLEGPRPGLGLGAQGLTQSSCRCPMEMLRGEPALTLELKTYVAVKP